MDKAKVHRSMKLQLSSRARFRDVGGEGVIVNLESGRVVVVNAVGLFIVQQLANQVTENEVVDLITAAFDVSDAEAQTDLSEFLNNMAAEKLVLHV